MKTEQDQRHKIVEMQYTEVESIYNRIKGDPCALHNYIFRRAQLIIGGRRVNKYDGTVLSLDSVRNIDRAKSALRFNYLDSGGVVVGYYKSPYDIQLDRGVSGVVYVVGLSNGYSVLFPCNEYPYEKVLDVNGIKVLCMELTKGERCIVRPVSVINHGTCSIGRVDPNVDYDVGRSSGPLSTLLNNFSGVSMESVVAIVESAVHVILSTFDKNIADRDFALPLPRGAKKLTN